MCWQARSSNSTFEMPKEGRATWPAKIQLEFPRSGLQAESPKRLQNPRPGNSPIGAADATDTSPAPWPFWQPLLLIATTAIVVLMR